MGKFDGILFCTDLDGTLYKNDKTVKAFVDYYREHEEIHKYFVNGRHIRKIRDAYAVWKFKGIAGD